MQVYMVHLRTVETLQQRAGVSKIHGRGVCSAESYYGPAITIAIF